MADERNRVSLSPGDGRPIGGVLVTASANPQFPIPSWLHSAFLPSPISDRPCHESASAGAITQGTNGEPAEGSVVEDWGPAPDSPPPGVTTDEWIALTNAEKNLLWRYFDAMSTKYGPAYAAAATAAYVKQLSDIQDQAFDYSQEESNIGAHNGEQDAIRHSMWQCLLTKAFGSSIARGWGDAHEQGQPVDAEVRMDLYNNEIGRQVGVSSFGCAAGIRDAYRRNLLRLSPLEFNANGSFSPNPPADAPPPGNDL